MKGCLSLPIFSSSSLMNSICLHSSSLALVISICYPIFCMHTDLLKIPFLLLFIAPLFFGFHQCVCFNCLVPASLQAHHKPYFPCESSQGVLQPITRSLAWCKTIVSLIGSGQVKYKFMGTEPSQFYWNKMKSFVEIFWPLSWNWFFTSSIERHFLFSSGVTHFLCRLTFILFFTFLLDNLSHTVTLIREFMLL
jgi:hypothetical protein